MHEVWAVKVVWDAKTTPSVANCRHRVYYILSRSSSFVRFMVVVPDSGWAVICSLTNKTQDMNQIAETRVYISLLPAYSSNLFWSRIKHTAGDESHHQHPELSRHHMTCTKSFLSFRNTPDNLHNFVRSLCASFWYIQLYHNANASDVDLFSNRSNGTKRHPQTKVEGNCEGKNADISDKSTPVVWFRLYRVNHLRTYPWTHPDIQCLRHQGWEGLGALLWYNLSWSSHDSPLFTIPADVAPLQKQEFAFSGVVGSVPLMYGANIWHNPWSNEQLEVGQPLCLWGSSRSLQSADNQLGQG